MTAWGNALNQPRWILRFRARENHNGRWGKWRTISKCWDEVEAARSLRNRLQGKGPDMDFAIFRCGRRIALAALEAATRRTR